MKTYLPFFAIIIFFQLVSNYGRAQAALRNDTVVMGPGYTEEVYFRLNDGLQLSGSRSTWDIAFRTSKLSSGIMTNDGSGVTLYTYPHADTSGWSAMDTTGLAGWTPMYNDPSDWENGAFSRNALGHPDYGWGIYNMTTHVLTGDSLFIIKLRDNTFRKLWIILKDAPRNTWSIRYAALDGTGEVQFNFDADNYMSVDYIGFDMATASLVNFQQEKGKWDILFTRYMSLQDDGTPYPVTGVLSNPYAKVKRFYPVPLDYTDWNPGDWDSTRSPIGWDWKVFDMTSFSYKIVDSLVYFVSDSLGDVYKVYFTAFEGSTNGKIRFTTEKMAGAGTGQEQSVGLRARLFPNPSNTTVNLFLSGHTGELITLTVSDLSGRKIRYSNFAAHDDELMIPVDISGMKPGMYLVTVETGSNRSVSRLIVR